MYLYQIIKNWLEEEKLIQYFKSYDYDPTILDFYIYDYKVSVFYIAGASCGVSRYLHVFIFSDCINYWDGILHASDPEFFNKFKNSILKNVNREKEGKREGREVCN